MCLREIKYSCQDGVDRTFIGGVGRRLGSCTFDIQTLAAVVPGSRVQKSLVYGGKSTKADFSITFIFIAFHLSL